MADETTAAPGDPARPATPETDKLIAVSEESQKLGAFLEWLESGDGAGLTLCTLERDVFTPSWTDINVLLARYFKINLSKVEQERRALLQYVRSQQG